jgi:formylglycine-generating enzyme required for sulfatase activity/predicted esterase
LGWSDESMPYTAPNREGGPETSLTDVFLSYARQDRDRIAPLVRALEARGLEVWWDSRIAGGTEFTREIEAQLEAAGAVLVVWSRISVESLWVADEASAGLERGKLVPISIDPVPPRIGFRQLQTLEFGAWNQDPSDPCVTGLLEALAAAGVRSRAPPAAKAKPHPDPPVLAAAESPPPSANPPKAAAPRTTQVAALRRPAVAVPLAAVLAAALAGLGWWALQARERTHARAELIKLEEMVAERDLVGAWLLARKLEPVLGEDRELERLRLASTWPVSFRSEPPGAEIEFRGYLDDPDVWYPIGTTPIEAIRLPAKAPLFRAAAPGHVVVEGVPPGGGSPSSPVVTFALWQEENASEGLLRIPGGGVQLTAMLGDPAPVELPPFWLGRHEVTNREFQFFVDAGGYRDPAFWHEPFERDGRTLEWEEAIADFVDATGRPGPSTWRLGAFPDGQEDHPVTGVSWYEAAAFARWAEAELPTLHHWFRAAVPEAVFSEILQRARFGGDGTVPVGSSHAIGPFGHHDMAGNAFEWTASADREGRRYAAGGAWDEPSYTFLAPAALDPYDRGSNRGLRLARYDGAVPEVTRQPLAARGRPDFADREPVGEEMFAAFESFYAYDQRPLQAVIHSVDDASMHYRWERVSYDAAYGGERVLANLLLPKNASPPYQVVVFFPGSEAETLDSSLVFHGLPFYEFILRSGRAVLYPVYKNMFERKIPGWAFSPASRRDVLIQWRKDLGRSIDYIASREDLDGDRIAFYGHSLGAVYGTVLTALEPRLAAALMLGGGMNSGSLPPEADPLNFAPRVRLPTLMLTGRDDFIRPVETHQVPLFNLLGVPDEQKQLARFDGGHAPSDMNAVIREALAWLDRWLGPVEP